MANMTADDLDSLAQRMVNLQPQQAPTPAVEAVSVKIPDFAPTSTKAWFFMLESQFTTKNITTEETKFSHACTGLNTKQIEKLDDFLQNPPAQNKYTAFKAAVEEAYGLTDEDKQEAWYTLSDLGDLKPTEMLRKIKRLLPATEHNSYAVRWTFLKTLPPLVRTILSKNAPLDINALAAEADRVLRTEAMTRTSTMAISSAPRSARPTQADRKPGQSRCFYHTKWSSDARRCGPTLSGKPCDMAGTTPSGNGTAGR